MPRPTQPSTVSLSQEVQAQNDRDNLEFDFFENEFIYNYEEPTYYFRWGILPQAEFQAGFGKDPDAYKSFGENLASKIAGGIDRFDGAIIIAESGVTSDLNIRNVEFESVIGLQDGATKGNATVIKMEIFEPFGMSLVDNLSLAANILGVKNWLTAPMHILELKFKGKQKKNISNRKDDVFPFGDCVWKTPNVQKNLYSWHLQLKKMSAKVDSGGTVYHIEAALTENFAKDVQHVSISKMMTGNLKTPKKITDFIYKEMNKFQKSQRNQGVSMLDHTFEIVWESSEELKKDLSTVFNIIKVNPPWNGEIAPAQDDTARTEGMGINKDGSFSWNDGTSIQQIIKDLQVSTEELRILMHGRRLGGDGKQTGTALDSNEEELKRVFKYEWRVETSTILKGYDIRIGDYAYHFVYHIVPFAISLGVSDDEKPKSRDKKNPANKANQKNRVKRFRNSGVVRKKYDYMYTGLNQDVLNFDIDLNLFWFAQVPKATSAYTETDAGIIQTQIKRRIFGYAESADTIKTLPGVQKAVLDLVGRTKGDVLKAVAKKLNINTGNLTGAENLLVIGAELARTGQVDSAFTTALSDISEAKLQQITDTAQTAISTDIDVANSQRLIRSIVSEGTTFGIFKDEYVKAAQSSLLELNSIDQVSGGNNIQKQLAMIKTLRSLQGQIRDEDKITLNQQLGDQIAALESKIRAAENLKHNAALEFKKKSQKASGRKQSKFLLDLKDQFNTPEDRKQFELFIQESNPALFPISVKADISDVSAGGDTATTQNDPASISQSLTMAMMNQIYGANAVWSNITLTIRGDPFWIGPGVGRQEGFATSEKRKDPDFDKKQNMFLFELRFPENYNSETGSMSFSSENIFKGLYIVTTVKHEFKDGKFIQQIDAVREVLTNMLK